MDPINTIRAFNRSYTRHLGLLSHSFLDSGMTLTEVRVLYEIDEGAGQTTARGLCQALGVDEGYLSRILARCEREGWLARQPDPRDARRRLLATTKAGQGEAGRGGEGAAGLQR